MRGGARRRWLDGAGRLGGGGKRRRGCSGEGWARGSSLGVARGRGAANGGGYWGGAGLEWRLRGEVSSPGFGVERRWRSEAWERGESKRAHEIDFWGMCSARALARRGRRALPGAVHGGVAVAAVEAALEAAGCVARPGNSSARQQEGEEERCDTWVPARGGVMAGKAFPGAGGGAVGGRRREQSREVGDGDKGRFVISKNSRDPTVKQR